MPSNAPARASLSTSLAVVAFAVVVAASGCPKKPAAVDAGSVVDAGAVGGGSGSGAGGGGGGGGGAGGGGSGGGQRFPPPVVYLDGVAIGVVQFGEMPPTLSTTWLPMVGLDKPVRRFALLDYIAALGVDVKKLKMVHLYSGRSRIVAITGEELRSETEKTMFSFTQSNSGKVQMRWSEKSTVKDRIDKVVNIALYIDKPAPVRIEGKNGLFLDGKELDSPPYVTMDVQGGTRVYLDGRLQTIIRPHDSDVEGKSDGLLAIVGSRGIAVDGVKSGELIWKDEVAQRLTDVELKALHFAGAGPGTAGALLTVPGDKKFSVVLLYKNAPPPDWSKR